MSKLTLVPTPVGNLGDITLRALEVLKDVDLILAEDTRKTGLLLRHFQISKPMRSHHKFNEHKTIHGIVDRILAGDKVALVCDAGTPGISDPGFLLIRECLRNNLEIECLPGATAFIPALIDSGLPSDKFHFEGFLPHKKGRKTRLEYLSTLNSTMIFYESPFRLAKTLDQLVEYFGADRLVSVSRELTKIHEETKRNTLHELKEYYSTRIVKGEVVIVVGGKE